MSVPGEEITQQDANTEVSSEPQPSTDSNQLQSSAPESTETPNQAEPNVPFHEHPRFKELIEQNRGYKSALEQYQEQMQNMQKEFQTLRQAQQPPKEVHPFKQALAGIDPKWAEYLDTLESQASKAVEIEKQFQEMQRQQLRSTYENTIQKLHSEHKMSPELQTFIKEQVDALALSGQIKDMKDLPSTYKAVADKYSKLIDSVKRAERASYVTDKSKDAGTPSVPKGKAPPRNEKGQFTGDRESDMALIAQRVRKLSKAEGDL